MPHSLQNPPPGYRFTGWRGQQLRKKRLEDHPLCQDCERKGLVVEATEVDHIIPLAKGGQDIDRNCRCLCHECHLKRTAEQFNQRKRVTIGLSGWPIEEEGSIPPIDKRKRLE